MTTRQRVRGGVDGRQWHAIDEVLDVVDAEIVFDDRPHVEALGGDGGIAGEGDGGRAVAGFDKRGGKRWQCRRSGSP